MGGKYSIELFRKGGEDAGVEQVLNRYENLSIARAVFKAKIGEYPGRLIMLRDSARILARSDQPIPSSMSSSRSQEARQRAGLRPTSAKLPDALLRPTS